MLPGKQFDARCDQSNTVSGRYQVLIGRAGDSVHMNSSAIAASGLRKAYRDKTILDGFYGVRFLPVTWEEG